MEPQKAADVNACAGGQHEEDEPAVLETGMVRAGQLGELAGGMVEADGAENQTGKRADQHHGKNQPHDRVGFENPGDVSVGMEPGEVEKIRRNIGCVRIKEEPDD